MIEDPQVQATRIAQQVNDGLNVRVVKIPDMSKPLGEYIAVRDGVEGQDALYRVMVAEFSSAEALNRYDTAVKHNDTELAEAATSAMNAALDYVTGKSCKKKDMSNPANFSDHPKIRYQSYNRLATWLNYMGLEEPQRIPLPILCEMIVKAAFPGKDATKDDFTGFIASSREKMEQDFESRQKTATGSSQATSSEVAASGDPSVGLDAQKRKR